MAFRRFGPTEDPQRAPAKMKDYFEADSEVPVAPFPTTFRELQSDELGWSDEEVGVGNEEMREAPAEGHEDEAAAEERAGQRKEVEMDAIRYSLDNCEKYLREQIQAAHEAGQLQDGPRGQDADRDCEKAVP